ncbi:DUF397 domain-containing protein [Streptantibioticus rubrisoli]|uniref:DUF397 domain-containing protein n=1 Tax=Streptantibioticus rubrisoli TaxID=1387313 RepID=A0ABT1PKT6_9ACTN|nr:DUF397 domain-containing protein [Streptantibioticus rubrisoli]MCQ4045986.1 DUF397 domain-containing protein [Streptantibioticus rubrisoli]
MSPLHWQKSSFSGTGSNCLNVAISTPGTIHLRESDRPEVILTTTPARLADLLRRIKAGGLDRP